MTVHLIKLCVGVDDVGHLAGLQAGRLAEAAKLGGAVELKHVTRNTPRQASQILDGGSLYWVIRGFIRVRQAIIAIRPAEKTDGRPACALVLDQTLVRTELRSFCAFQGWRYLAAEDVPKDAGPYDIADDEVPAKMAAELKDLGLL